MTNTDDAPAEVVIAAILQCARSWQGDARIIGDIRAKDIIRALSPEIKTATKYSIGHCTQNSQPGGCQLHNLQCGWPECDRRPLDV